jgi:hypothetical protein
MVEEGGDVQGNSIVYHIISCSPYRVHGDSCLNLDFMGLSCGNDQDVMVADEGFDVGCDGLALKGEESIGHLKLLHRTLLLEFPLSRVFVPSFVSNDLLRICIE